MISAPTPINTSNMTNESMDIDTATPPRRPGRRARNTLSTSLTLGTTTSSTTTTSLNSQRAQEASLKSSFVTDRQRTGLSGTHGRLSQSFIESSGEGLDDDTIKDILKGFEDGGSHVEYNDGEQDEEEKGGGGGGGTNNNYLKRPMSVTKPMRGGVRRGGRRNMLESIESQKSMHFNCDGDE